MKDNVTFKRTGGDHLYGTNSAIDDELKALATYYQSKVGLRGSDTMLKNYTEKRTAFVTNPAVEFFDDVKTNLTFLHADYNKTISEATKKWGENVFFYCDPPYFGSEGVYGMDDFDHKGLREALEGKNFMVSYDDCPQARELYAGFELFEYTTTRGKRKELLISSTPSAISPSKAPEEDDMEMLDY